MKTQDAINSFLKHCRERGLSLRTIESCSSHLRHFNLAIPELPLEFAPIDRFLTRVIRKKSARYEIRKTLLAFYSFLDKEGIGSNPIPRLKVGRPKKSTFQPQELGRGGQTVPSELTSTSLSTRKAIDDFRDSRRVAPATWKWYYHFFKRLLEHFPEELPVSPEPLEHCIFSFGPSPEYQHDAFRAIRALYFFLEKRHRLPIDPRWGVQNPIRLIKAPRVPKKLPASLSAPELQKLFAATENDMERAFLLLCADCGLRGGEIASLRAENIELDLIRVQGKTGERLVSISPEVRDTLLAIAPKNGFVFNTPFGNPYTTATLYKVVKALLERAGIEKRHRGTHLLRHTFGRQAVAAGADLVTVQKQMGHREIKTTRIYTELSQDEIHKRHLETSPAQQLVLLRNNHNEGIEVQP